MYISIELNYSKRFTETSQAPAPPPPPPQRPYDVSRGQNRYVMLPLKHA